MQRETRFKADARIGEALSTLSDEFGVDFVLGYLALRDEVCIDGFLSRMVETGRPVLLPRIGDGGLRFAQWRPCDRLTRDEKGVLAPDAAGEEEIPRGNGLIVVPARAFDPAGRRLGRGGGYYDRFLEAAARGRAVVGVAYECQIFERVVCEDHDRGVDVVVTEAGCRRIH